MGAPELVLDESRLPDEGIHVYLATGLCDSRARRDENERIEIVPWPLDRLDERSRSQGRQDEIGLLLLRARR